MVFIYRTFIILLAAIGLFGSLKAVLATYGPESDVIHSLVLWDGIREHGISWIQDWKFAQDNWLLSLIPLHFIGFALFGAKPIVVILFGWLIYILNAFVSAAIVWKVGAKKAAIPVFLLLINFGVYAYTRGLIAYPISHSITNLLGLGAVLILMIWLQQPRSWLLALLCVALVCGAISDPWMLPAYNLPLLILSLLLIIFPLSGIGRMQGVMLSAVIIISIIATQTQLFGILDFLPAHGTSISLRALHQDEGIIYLIKNLGGLLSLVPFAKPNSLLGGLLSIFICLFLLARAISLTVQFRLSIQFNLVVAYCVFACLAMVGMAVASITIGGPGKGEEATRYLINIPYVGIIALGIISGYVWNSADVVYRRALGGAFLLFIFTSLLSIWPYISDRSFKMRDVGVPEIITFLKEHGLSYGYGGYFSAEANAVTLASHAEIRIRPVEFDGSGMMGFENQPQRSNRWYLPEDVPAGITEFFVLVSPAWGDCPDMALCIEGLKRQFGDPSRILSKGDAKILVWNHRLLGRPIHVLPNNAYLFGDGKESVNGVGWSKSEPWGVWSNGHLASLRFDVRNIKSKHIAMTIESGCFSDKQEITLIANGQVIDRLQCATAGDHPAKRVVNVPHYLIANDGILDLKWLINKPASPRRFFMVLDPRKLGFALVSISFQ